MTTNLGKTFDGLLIALLTIFERVVFLQIWPRKHFVYFFVVKIKLLGLKRSYLLTSHTLVCHIVLERVYGPLDYKLED
jgi:hypothetical protein